MNTLLERYRDAVLLARAIERFGAHAKAAGIRQRARVAVYAELIRRHGSERVRLHALRIRRVLDRIDGGSQ